MAIQTAVVRRADRITATLPMAELAQMVRALQRPNSYVFWTDLVLSAGIFWTAFGIALAGPLSFAMPAAIVAPLAGYRCGVFVHELVHLGRRAPRGLRTAWHVLFGVPLLMPAFLYEDHRVHHIVSSFGTEFDNEYVPRRGWAGLGLVVATSIWLPVGLFLRFLVLVPLAAVSPPVRDWVDRHASSLGPIGLTRREPPSAAERQSQRWWSAACVALVWIETAAIVTGFVSAEILIRVVLIVWTALMVNALRLMVSHRYLMAGIKSPGREAQFLDSVNFVRSRWLTWWWAPLGLHLHALHHLFPSIPYHNMAEAHRRISAALPAYSFYHAVEGRGLLHELAAFIEERPFVLPEQHGAGQ